VTEVQRASRVALPSLLPLCGQFDVHPRVPPTFLFGPHHQPRDLSRRSSRTDRLVRARLGMCIRTYGRAACRNRILVRGCPSSHFEPGLQGFTLLLTSTRGEFPIVLLHEGRGSPSAPRKCARFLGRGSWAAYPRTNARGRCVVVDNDGTAVIDHGESLGAAACHVTAPALERVRAGAPVL
jgi:hypothetical protein